GADVSSLNLPKAANCPLPLYSEIFLSKGSTPTKPPANSSTTSILAHSYRMPQNTINHGYTRHRHTPRGRRTYQRCESTKASTAKADAGSVTSRGRWRGWARQGTSRPFGVLLLQKYTAV
ncbi:unnamed protein product, partial [Ectocarpus sp. 12 AP-2014]